MYINLSLIVLSLKIPGFNTNDPATQLTIIIDLLSKIKIIDQIKCK